MQAQRGRRIIPDAACQKFKVQVCPGGTARLSGSAQPLACCNHLPGPDIEILHVGIERFLPVPMGQPDIVAVSGSTPGGGHHASSAARLVCPPRRQGPRPGGRLFPGKGILPPAIRSETRHAAVSSGKQSVCPGFACFRLAPAGTFLPAQTGSTLPASSMISSTVRASTAAR